MRSVFLGTTAFVGRIDSETRCAFWTDEPVNHKFDPERLVTVDLALNPSAAAMRQISWDAVQVDDTIITGDGHQCGTTIGPRWPEFEMVGGIYLEESTWKRLPANLRFANPPEGMQARDYEVKTVVYWTHIDDPRAGKRYIGHYAEILEERGTLARVAIYAPGTSLRPNARPTTMWIDLSSADYCDVGRNSLTEIGIGTAPKRGALFLSLGNVAGAKDSTKPVRASLRDLADEAGTSVHGHLLTPPSYGDGDVVMAVVSADTPKKPALSGDAGTPTSAVAAAGPKLSPTAGDANTLAGAIAAVGPKLGQHDSEILLSSPKSPKSLGD